VILSHPTNGNGGYNEKNIYSSCTPSLCAGRDGGKRERSGIKVLSTIALQSVMEDLALESGGDKVTITFGLSGAIVKRVQEGETADLLLVPQSAVDGLLKAASATRLGLQPCALSIGVACAKARRNRIFRRGGLSERLSPPSPSATPIRLRWSKRSSLRQGAERLGIAEEMKAKTKHPPEGGAARLLAAGEAEIAVQQIGELQSVEGIDVLGPLPGDLQSVTTYAAAIPSAAHQPESARALVKYLQSPEAAAVMKAKGLDSIADSR
jgi:molybdate transport system substrate-binding protein